MNITQTVVHTTNPIRLRRRIAPIAHEDSRVFGCTEVIFMNLDLMRNSSYCWWYEETNECIHTSLCLTSDPLCCLGCVLKILHQLQLEQNVHSQHWAQANMCFVFPDRRVTLLPSVDGVGNHEYAIGARRLAGSHFNANNGAQNFDANTHWIRVRTQPAATQLRPKLSYYVIDSKERAQCSSVNCSWVWVRILALRMSSASEQSLWFRVLRCREHGGCATALGEQLGTKFGLQLTGLFAF